MSAGAGRRPAEPNKGHPSGNTTGDTSAGQGTSGAGSPGRRHMKWWGWGDPGQAFDHTDKPGLRAFLLDRLGVDIAASPAPPPDPASLLVDSPRLPPSLLTALQAAVGPDRVQTGDAERLVHASGKSLRDLIEMRSGTPGRLPDVIVYPETEQHVVDVLQLALHANAVLIPFGGGSSISGSLRVPADETRPAICVDLADMNRVTAIDGHSRLATIQAGALGPDLEEQLARHGWTLGHFPDSFLHSTLGGWIATRSSGMQSDSYGDIADIVQGVRVVTPSGILHTRPVPASSAGPSVTEMVLGSEGRLGITTESTVRIRRRAPHRRVLAYLFPNWPRGLAAIADARASQANPIFKRLADAEETAFSFALGRAEHGTAQGTSRAVDFLLRRILRRDPAQQCLAFVGFEGTLGEMRRNRRVFSRIARAYGGLPLGSRPGALYDQKKFDTPYLRDFLLDRGVLADVCETAAPWSRLAGLHEEVFATVHRELAGMGLRGSVMCHLSHTYHSGACLYFTFALVPAGDAAPIALYDRLKAAIQQAFIDGGATLSHHHAVGTEHARWLPDDVSPAGAHLIGALFSSADPGRNLNPNKIV